MNDAELEAALRRVTQRSATGGVLVGVFTFGMGMAAASCAAVRGDPEMARYSVGMWAAYGGMVCFFVAAGIAIAGSALFVVPRKASSFVNTVMLRPESVARVWLLLVKSKYNPNSAPGQLGVGTSLCVTTKDDELFQFVVPGAEAHALMDAIIARAPQAMIGPP